MPIFKTINPEFFKVWNPSMAYVLGYFAADGSMLKNKRGGHFIEFTSVDKGLIEKVRNLLNSNHKIAARKRAVPHRQMYRLQIGSKSIYEDLKGLGFTQAKSMTLNFPKIPSQFISHFIRGYFDGDGHVSVCNYKRSDRVNTQARTIISGFTSGSKSFLLNLHNKLRQYADVFGGSVYYNRGYRLNFSVNDSRRLSDFLYINAQNLYLERKKKVFDSYFQP